MLLSCMMYFRPSGPSGPSVRVLDLIAIYNTPDNQMLCSIGVGGRRAYRFSCRLTIYSQPENVPRYDAVFFVGGKVPIVFLVEKGL